MLDPRRRAYARRILCLALAALGLAAATPSDPEQLPDAQQQEWAGRLAAAQRAIDLAKQRVEQLEAAYSRAQHSHYPRGQARAELIEDLDRARRDLEAAQRALPALVEEARRAGVYPEVLRPYEGD